MAAGRRREHEVRGTASPDRDDAFHVHVQAVIAERIPTPEKDPARQVEAALRQIRNEGIPPGTTARMRSESWNPRFSTLQKLADLVELHVVHLVAFGQQAITRIVRELRAWQPDELEVLAHAVAVPEPLRDPRSREQRDAHRAELVDVLHAMERPATRAVLVATARRALPAPRRGRR